MLDLAAPSLSTLTTLACLVLVLWLKGLWLSFLQVRGRWRARAFARAEDARMFGLEVADEPAIVGRAAAAWRNELESAPIFLMTAISAVLAKVDPALFAAACATFVGARLVQGYAEVHAKQPSRTIAWLVGVASHAALVVLLVWTLSERAS